MILYTKKDCPYCKVAKAMLTDYEEVPLDDNQVVVEAIEKKLGFCIVPLVFDEIEKFFGLIYVDSQPRLARLKAK